MRNAVARTRMVWIAAIVALLVMKGESSVQQRAAGGLPPCSKNTPVSLDNIEKFNWTFCDFDLGALWNALGIPAGDFSHTQSLSQASSSSGDLDGDKVDERVLSLQQYSAVSRIVVLKRKPDNTWTSLGFMDIPTFHLSPSARVMTNGRGRWLAVSHHTDSVWGTGIFQEDEKWFAFEKGRFVEVLSFPGEGHLEGPLSVQWTVNAQAKAFDDSEDRVDVEYSLKFGSGVPSFRQTVSFAKKPSSRNFQFDSKASKMSKGDFLSIFDVAKFTWPQFFKVIRSATKDDSSVLELQKRVLASCHEVLPGFNECEDIARSIKTP